MMMFHYTKSTINFIKTFLCFWAILMILEYTNSGVGYPACYYHWFAGIWAILILGAIALPIILARIIYPYGGIFVSVSMFIIGLFLLRILIKRLFLPLFRYLTCEYQGILPTGFALLIACVSFGGFVHWMRIQVAENPLPAPPFAGSLNGGHGDLIPKWKPTLMFDDGQSSAFLDKNYTTLVVFLDQKNMRHPNLSRKKTIFMGPEGKTIVPYSPNLSLFFLKGNLVATCPLYPGSLSVGLDFSEGELYGPLYYYAIETGNEELKEILTTFYEYFDPHEEYFQESPIIHNNISAIDTYRTCADADSRFRPQPDTWNRLVRVTSSDVTPIATYTYDGLNRRILKTTPTETREYYYNKNWQCIQEVVDAQPTTHYVWRLCYIDDLICRHIGLDKIYSLTNPNWNVVPPILGSRGCFRTL
ncbi:MAG: hypothetical protein Q4D38_01225 [Planctomycetia bacterium]|nr:hypothetical protein [Planctomycetia bacterium]